MKPSNLKALVCSGWIEMISSEDLESGRIDLIQQIDEYQQQPKPLMDYQAKELDLLLRILSDVQLEIDYRNPFLQSWHE